MSTQASNYSARRIAARAVRGATMATKPVPIRAIETPITTTQALPAINADQVAEAQAARTSAILKNAGLLKLTAREKFDNLPAGAQGILRSCEQAGMGDFGVTPTEPRDAAVVRIVASVGAFSCLTPAERWSLLPEASRKILTAFQAAGGGSYVPTDTKEISQ
jgi:hypothetical protein